MTVFFDTPVDKSLGVTGTWTDIDLSLNVPAGATGAIFQIINTVVDNPQKFGLRKKGSTDNRYKGIGGDAGTFALIGIDANRKCQGKIDVTDIDFYLVGYTLEDAAFFTNAYDKSQSTTGTWTDLDLSAEVPAGTVAVIFEIVNTGTSAKSWGMRKKGSTDNRYGELDEGCHLFFVIGVDGNRGCEFKIESWLVDFYLLGYLTAGVAETNGIDRSLGSTGSYIDITETNAPNNATGAYGQLYTSQVWQSYAARKNGSSWDKYKVTPAENGLILVGLDGDKKWEGKISNTSVDFYTLGYFSLGRIEKFSSDVGVGTDAISECFVRIEKFSSDVGVGTDAISECSAEVVQTDQGLGIESLGSRLLGSMDDCVGHDEIFDRAIVSFLLKLLQKRRMSIALSQMGLAGGRGGNGVMDYGFRKKCTVVATVAGAQTNYQMELIVGESSGAVGAGVHCNAHCQDFPNDIRFTKEDGQTKHDYWIDTSSLEGITPNRKVSVWIEVASVPTTGAVDFYMYYGKAADSGESDGSATFEFFDDFSCDSSTYALMHNLLKGKPWARHASNPVLEKSPSSWDPTGVRDPELMIDTSGYLVQESGNYILYYNGYDIVGSVWERRIGRATSPDEINWTKNPSANPVLSEGAAGQWDEGGVWLGSVVKKGANDYIMFYAGFSGTVYGIGIAESTDGINWTKYVNNPILDESDFAVGGTGVLALTYCIKLSNGTWVLYFEGKSPSGVGYHIYGAQSTDDEGKTNWAALNSGDAVIEPSAGEWDSADVANPKICEIENGKYVIAYDGYSIGNNYRYILGFAESTDLVNWTKYSENPVMLLGTSGEWDDYRIEGLTIAKDDVGSSSVRMWYFGIPTVHSAQDAAVGHATCDQNAIKNEGEVDWVNRWQSVSEDSYATDSGRLELKESVTGWENAIYSQDSFADERAIRYKVTFASVGDASIYTGLSKNKPLTDWIFLFDQPSNGFRYKNTSDASIVLWSGPILANKEYEVIAIKKGTNLWHFELYEDGIEKVNVDKADVTSETSKYFVFLRSNTVDIGHIDNTLVSKYTSPEPTWGSWGLETEEGSDIGIVLKLLHAKELNMKLSQKQ